MIDTSVVMISWCPNAYRLNVLKKSFKSLKDCTQYPHTLVVVDNGLQEQTEYLKKQEIDIHIVNEVNKGVGISRNIGAEATDTEFIAFVDNDIGYYPGWLGNCIDALKKYDRKLIAAGVKNKPMRNPNNFMGVLDEYELFKRCAGMCVVLRRETLKEFNGWSTATNVGHKFCASALRKDYRFIWKEGWNCRHLTRKPSYWYKYEVFNPETGEWINRKQLQESA